MYIQGKRTRGNCLITAQSTTMNLFFPEPCDVDVVHVVRKGHRLCPLPPPSHLLAKTLVFPREQHVNDHCSGPTGTEKGCDLRGLLFQNNRTGWEWISFAKDQNSFGMR